MILTDERLEQIKEKIINSDHRILNIFFNSLTVDYIQEKFYFTVQIVMLDGTEGFYSETKEYEFTFNELKFKE